MNKPQIRLMLEKEGIRTSNNRIGDVAVSLGFGDNISYTYSDEEARQILEAIRQDYQAKQQQQKVEENSTSTSPPLPTDDSRALTKQVIAQSTDTLMSQVKALASRMDQSDRTLARQLAEYVVERPQRFTVMFAEELNALMAPVQESPQTFIDADLVEIEMPDLRSDFMAIAPASALGCLPM